MIIINSLNKFYFKNKSNQNHVINDFSYEFNDTGLYTLFGQSGSGKTTLLNVIGLLDDFDSGYIKFNNIELNHYSYKTCDSLRNEMIGYIFQNYNLIDNLSVIENIETILDIIGISDKGERKKRIKESLDAVGLYKHRNRNVKALSGGERQRVAIARALAKNPSIILADEPTGNLDSNNTFEIMNIIKNISKERLVILVSHEKDLVEYYSDYILEIKDGKLISSRKNLLNDSLNYTDPRNVYIASLNKETTKKEPLTINLYKDDTNKDLNLDIVIMNNEVYVKANSELRIHYLDESSELRLIDKKEEDFISSIKDKEANIDLSSFDESLRNKKSNLTSVFKSFKESFKGGKFIKRNKITRIGLSIAAGIIAIVMSSFSSIFDFSEKDYIKTSYDTVGVRLNNTDKKNERNVQSLMDDAKGLYESAMTYDINYGGYFLDCNFQRFIQTYSYFQSNVYIFPELIDNRNPIYLVGNGLNLEENDIVISTWVADELLNSEYSKANGFFEYSDLIGLKGNITDTYYNEHEVVIKAVFKSETYETYLSDKLLDKLTEEILTASNPIFFVTNDKEALMNKLKDYSDVYIPNETAKIEYIINRLEEKESNIWALTIMLIITAIYVLLITRSSMFERIKDVGVLRTIGATKREIKSIFVGEIIAITTRYSLLSYSFVFLIISLYSKLFDFSMIGLKLFGFDIIFFIIGIMLIYLVNVLFSLIPVNKLLRKTPIEITKKYDI